MPDEVPPYRVRARVLFFYFALSLIVSVILVVLIWPSWLSATPRLPLPESTMGFVWYLLLFALLLRPVKKTRGSLGALLGNRPDFAFTRWAVITAVALMGISLASFYALFLPLSYAAPGLVHWWIIEDPFVLFWTEGESYLIANVISFLSLAIIGPVVEEVFFRGLVVPAWSERIGAKWAVIWSSVIFAVFHADIVGSFLFGAVTALVYLQTRSLWLPVIIHVTNNTLAWLLTAAGTMFSDAPTETLADFQASWWLGAVGLLVGAPLMIFAARRLRAPWA